LRGEAGEVGAVDADLQYQSRFGRYELRQSTLGGQAATSVWASGAIVGIGGRLFASRPVEQSYGLVRVPGVANVRAFVSHQEIGRTDRRGDLLVPDLVPYYGNILSIADEDVPLELTIDRRQLTLAPPAGGGALALFHVSRQARAFGRLQINEHGAVVVPAYGRIEVRVKDATLDSPLGAGGEFYLEGLAPGPHPARVEYKGGTCDFTLQVPDVTAAVVQLGLVRCLAN
jgi:outer membrane usher protein